MNECSMRILNACINWRNDGNLFHSILFSWQMDGYTTLSKSHWEREKQRETKTVRKFTKANHRFAEQSVKVKYSINRLMVYGVFVSFLLFDEIRLGTDRNSIESLHENFKRVPRTKNKKTKEQMTSIPLIPVFNYLFFWFEHFWLWR